MAVYPDRIVLKNSTDLDADIRSAIAPGGTDEIFYGEVVLGLSTGNARLYTRDANDNIVAFGGSNSESTDNLEDVDLTGLEDLDILQWIESEQKFRPRSMVEAGALTAVADDTSPTLGGDLNVSLYGFTADSASRVVPHEYYGRFNGLQIRGASTNSYLGLAYNGGSQYTYNLPTTDGSAGYALVTDGAGNMSWSAGVSADISQSPWDGLSNIFVRQSASPNASVWSVFNSANDSVGIFKPCADDGTGDQDQGLRVSENGFCGIYNNNSEGRVYIEESTASPSLAGIWLKHGSVSLRLTPSGYFGYNTARPVRLSDDQFATFGDLDNLESSLQGEMGDIALNDLSDVDLVTIPPQPGETLVYSSTAFGGLGGWQSASLPGTGTVTSVDLANTGGLEVSGGPIFGSGVIDVGLETIETISPGSYSFPNITVDLYGRITSISSGGNGSGLVTSVNGQTGDVSLGIFDLTDVEGIPSNPATQVPSLSSEWTFQSKGSETVVGNGRWKSQIDAITPTVSFLKFSNTDGSPFNWTTILTGVISAHGSGITQYLEVTSNGVAYTPVEISSIFSDGIVTTVEFATASLNVGLFNDGDSGTDGATVTSKTITIGLGPEESFDFGEQDPIDGQILKWNSSKSAFEPHTQLLADNFDVTNNNPADGYLLRYSSSINKWTAVSVGIGDLDDVNTTTTLPTTDQALVWNGSEWVPGDVNSTTEWVLSANGSSAYIFNGPGLSGAENPDIYLIRGSKYRFTNPMNAHPFRIQSNPGTGGVPYSLGITNNGVTDGSLDWEVRMDSPAILYYQCTSHENMRGTIYILDESGSGGVESLDDLSDVDTSTIAPQAGQALVWSGSQWTPSDQVSGGSITVQERAGSGGTPENPATNINTISFNTNNGFSVTDLGDGEALVNLGSAFAPWLVDGQPTLDPEGEEPVEFVAGENIVITTDPNATPQRITISSTGGGGSGGGGGGGSTTQKTTQSLATSASGDATFDQLGFSGTLVSITSSANAWVVLYESEASRTADASRPFTDDPAPGSGVLAEMYITAGDTVLATPGTTYFNGDSTLTEALYVAVRDQQGSGVVSTVQITAYADKVITSISGGTFGSG